MKLHIIDVSGPALAPIPTAVTQMASDMVRRRAVPMTAERQANIDNLGKRLNHNAARDNIDELQQDLGRGRIHASTHIDERLQLVTQQMAHAGIFFTDSEVATEYRRLSGQNLRNAQRYLDHLAR